MTDCKTYNFPNGDMLSFDAVNAYAGYHGLTVYTVSYLEYDSGEECFRSCNGDSYMSKAAAMAGFDARLASPDPSHCLKKDGGVTNLVLDAFQKYLGEGTLRSIPMPNEWDAFAKQVFESTFSRDRYHYDGEKIYTTLKGLSTTSTKESAGQSNIMLEIPAWKLLEIMTAITALALALKQFPSHPMLKAA